MHDTIVRMRDGRERCAPLWLFRPQEGWLALADDCERLYLRDMVSAVTPGQRIAQGMVGDRDELARAREEGWDGL